MCRAKPLPDPIGIIANLVFDPIKVVPISCTEPSPPIAQTISMLLAIAVFAMSIA